MTTRDHTDELRGASQHTLELLALNDSESLIDYLDELHPVELASLVNSFSEDLRSKVIAHVTGLDKISGLISYANENLRAEIIGELDNARIAAVVRRQDVDDAADILASLPRRRQSDILKRLSPQFSQEVSALLSYDHETAGRIMTTSFVSFPSSAISDDVVSSIRHKLRKEEFSPDSNITYLFVVEDEDKLVGVLSLRELLTAAPGKSLKELMQTDLVTVDPDDDQELVARLIVDYDFACIPVVSSDSTLLGIVTVDDVLDVIEEEHTEDILRLAGTEDQDTIGASVGTALKSRLPWLLSSWLGGVGAAMLLHSFESTLTQLVALAFFMPVVFGMGGNVGSQSSTITVRGIATGDLSRHRVFGRLQKEVLVGLLLGITFGALLAGAAYYLYQDITLCIIVGCSIMFTMVVASSLGSMLPVVFKQLGFDPAVASGPFVTTTTDILSILIYFSIASMLLN